MNVGNLLLVLVVQCRAQKQVANLGADCCIVGSDWWFDARTVLRGYEAAGVVLVQRVSL